MPPKSSSKSPKGTVKPRTPVTSLRGSGTSSTANPFGALNDESVAAADSRVDNKEGEEHDDSEDDEQQVFFGSVVESDANALLDRIESMYGHSSENPYFSPSVRQDFVELYSGLNDNGYNDDDKSAVVEMLMAGVSLQSLKDTLPVLGQSSSSSGLSLKTQPGDSLSHEAKVKAIRGAAVPSVEEVRSIFKDCVTGNGQTPTQTFLPKLNNEFRNVLTHISTHVGVHAQSFPSLETFYDAFTATGVLALTIAVNPIASLHFAFKDSGSVAVSEPVVKTSQGADQENDSTDIERLLLKSEAHGVSGAASKAKLASITANRRQGLFFTEQNDIRMNSDRLNSACSSLYTQIQARFTLPVKYIEGMLLLNELGILLMRFLKVVFKAFPLLFVGLEQKCDAALGIASQLSRHPRSQVNFFESFLQNIYDISCTRLLPYVAQMLILRLQPHGFAQIGSFDDVRAIYSLIVNGSSPVFAQLVAFTKQVSVATANTPIPKNLTLGTQCHPALLPQCTFELFVTQLEQYRSSFKLDASTKLALEDIFKSIASGEISSLEQLRAVIEVHSQKGLFSIVDSKKTPASSVALVSQASSGNPSVPRGAPPGTCVQFWKKGECRFGDGCRYNHASNDSKDSSIDSSVDTSKGKSPSADATSKSVKSSVKPSSFPPALSKAQAAHMEEYQSIMSTLQGYLRGAMSSSSPLFDSKSFKIGHYLKYIKVFGKDASGGFWETYSLKDSELPMFVEIEDLAKDARRLHDSLKPSLLSAKDIPFPSYPQTIMPPSLQSHGSKGNFDHGSKGSGGRGYGHASEYGKGKGHGYGYGKGSNYDWSSPPNPQARRGHGGNSFLSAAEEWQAWNAAQQPPPPQFSPYGPPQQPLPYGPEVPADAMASHQAMHMFLGQPSTARPLSSSGGSVSSMQHRGSAASSQAQTVESSSQSFWASGPKPPGGGNGNGKGRDFWN